MNWRAELGAFGLFVGIVALMGIWWLGFVVAAIWAIERVTS